ncbi:MAG TPA: peptidoglycan DD-metalloendopeptidase family protein [Steroidobacteraceae bacterium]
MRLAIKPGIPVLAPSRALWLQLIGCAVLASAWFRVDPPAVQPLPPAGAVQTPAPVAALTPTAAVAGLDFSTIQVIVGRNDTLYHIFRRLELNLADLATLRGLPSLREKLDRLNPGESLTLRHRGGELVGLERQISDSDKLQVVRKSDGFAADVLHRPLESRERTVHSVIRSSLFEAANAASLQDPTALALADIFRYDIDFVLDLRPGDEFTVTYEQLSQNGAYLKDGAILAAKFINAGREYQAVRYVGPDGVARYFTPDGRSIHKAFLRAPLEFTRVSSGFNRARRHPILNTIRAHKGTDYAAPIGTPVRAAGEGRVIFKGVMGGYGNMVQLAHAGGVTTVYGHLSRFARGLRVGQHVEQASVIAFVGMTGLATGPHLHYEYRVNGVFQNPQTVKLPDATPIDAALREDFTHRTAGLLASLEGSPGLALVAR